LNDDGRTTGRLLTAGLFAAVLMYCITPVYSENIFWHLRNGEDILDSFSIRLSDPFTWTMTDREWIQQEWLAEVVFAVGFRAAGPLGLSIVKTVVVMAAVALAVSAARRKGAGAAETVLVAVIWLAAAQARWFERPHIFTSMFFSLYLFILAGKPSLRRSLAMFAPLQILWVNTHAGFVMGLFLLLLPAVDAFFESGRSASRASRWLLLPAMGLLCSGVHPNGFRSLTYLPGFLSQPLFRETIREWWSPFNPRYGSAYLPTVLVAVTLAGLAIILTASRRGRRIPASSILLLGALTVSSAFAARNAELLALASIATLPPLLGRVHWGFPAAATAAAALIPPIAGLPREFGPPREFGTGIDWSIYPVGLADFIEEHGLYGRVFNTNEISGYLEYRFGERLPLYMDGRCLLYPESFYAEYLLLAQPPDSLHAALQLSIIESRGIEMALYDWPKQPGSTANLLAELPGWVPIYWDRLTIAYARLDWLRGKGLDSLSLGRVDPLSSEDLLTRPLARVEQGLLRTLLRGAGMEGWDAPAVIACCLLWRAGDIDGAAAAAGMVSDSSLRNEITGILDGSDAPGGGRSGAPTGTGSWPQINTLRVWVAVSEGRFQDAVRLASEMGDAQLETSILIVAGMDPSALTGTPPPGIPRFAWETYRSGGSTPSESMTILSWAAFAVGDLRLADSAAGAAGDPGPAAPWSISARATLLASSGFTDEATSLADSALSLSRNPFTLSAAGAVATLSGDPRNAAALLNEASTMLPEWREASIELASALWECGEIEASVSEYSRAASIGAVLPPAGRQRLDWGSRIVRGVNLQMR
jgi:hypothetical protein